MPKELPPPLYPWYRRAAADIWTWIFWPLTVREMKRAGFRHTGFMTWETGPDKEENHD